MVNKEGNNSQGGSFYTLVHLESHSLLNTHLVDVYADSLGGYAAFISNVDEKEDKMIVFQNVLSVPAWSVSILPDCKNVVFNTGEGRFLASSCASILQNIHH
ncbi:Beta-galactosidase 3 [Vitis vinifera]|uniref:Beta-galactosidase 3 n=1 Tax=Vitis vinifera TaxID=29760 RepID=A0A438CF26_VITVI|nr:Beta-galactosidase 3 [Vitis vinifera]